MSVFEYKGLDRSGHFLKGTLESENLRTAKGELKKARDFSSRYKG